jgi:hypothetical protein
MDANDIVGNVLIVVIAALIIAGSIWWAQYRYNDCKKVGHSTAYCLLDK